jgi:hypothetical protein
MDNTLTIDDLSKDLRKYNFFNMSQLKYFSVFLIERIINFFVGCITKSYSFTKYNDQNNLNKSKKRVTFDKKTIFKVNNDKQKIYYLKNNRNYPNYSIVKYSSYRVERLDDRKDLSNDEPLYF